jgi:outer membrane receptor protein involved in Fe transport
LTLSLGAGLLHTELKDFRSDGGVDLSGNRLVLAPSTTLNGLARYEFPPRDASWKIAAQADFRYQDKVYFSTASPLLAQPGLIWNALAPSKEDR